MRSVRAVLLCACLGVSSVSQAQDRKELPPELKVLQRMAGVWDEVLQVKATATLPKVTESKSVTRASWFLGGRVLRMEGAWQPGSNAFHDLVTYDPQAKVYRAWYFDASGELPRSHTTGTWDDKTLTLTWKSTDDGGNKTTGSTRFIDADTHEWTLTVTDPRGKVIVDLTAKKTRRK